MTTLLRLLTLALALLTAPLGALHGSVRLDVQGSPGSPWEAAYDPAIRAGSAVPVVPSVRHPNVSAGSTEPSAGAISGPATWFATGPGDAAAGPRLRAFLGPSWRGQWVLVTGPAGHAVVLLGDTTIAALVDLPPFAFVRVCGPLSVGVCTATVSRLPAPPATSTTGGTP